MTALLLATLFTAAFVLAIASIAETWRSHGAAVMSLRRFTANPGALSGNARELRFRLVAGPTARQHATIIRPDFSAVAMARQQRTRIGQALRAAA